VGLVCNSNTTTSTLTASKQSNDSTTMIDDTTPVLDDTTAPFDDFLHETTQKWRGRPKGTTKEQSQDLQQKIKIASEEAADKYSESRKQARLRNTRTKKGELTTIINECKEKHSIPDNIIIDPECICSRVKRVKHHGGISGNTSPMEDIEPYLVELMQQLENMRVPISCRQGLASPC
jgi:hypothetical protein